MDAARRDRDNSGILCAMRKAAELPPEAPTAAAHAHKAQALMDTFATGQGRGSY